MGVNTPADTPSRTHRPYGSRAHTGGQLRAGREATRQLSVAWSRVDRDAVHLAELCARAHLPTEEALSIPGAGDLHPAQVRGWLLSGYRSGSEVTSEVAGLMLLADGSLHRYHVVRGQLVLTGLLRDAVPDGPPSHDFFLAIAREILASE